MTLQLYAEQELEDSTKQIENESASLRAKYKYRLLTWGYGAIGNAFASRAKDWEFESLWPHYF